MADTSIVELPLEVLEYIVGFLSDGDLSRCCTVCKSWRNLFTNDTFWEKRCNPQLLVYLENTNCLVEPCFVIPTSEGSGLTPVTGKRLGYLREQHYLKNLRSGRYKHEEIEFDCDDSISYNIKVECVANDYVFLHTTFETQIWSVAQVPNLIMTVPFGLVELWETNLYKVLENKLIVVQCNVVQVFNINLFSKIWSFDRTLFFDRPEEFSLNINENTDVNSLHGETSHEIGESLDKVICGNFLIGIIVTKTALQDPVLHVWDLKTAKKIKEEKCSVFGTGISHIYLEMSESSNDKVIIACHKYKQKYFAVYSLTKLQFLGPYQCLNGDSLVFNDYLCILDHSQNRILKYNFDTNVTETVYKFKEGIQCWQSICGKIVLANTKRKLLLLSKLVETEFNISFWPGILMVLNDRYVTLHDGSDNLMEILELRTEDHSPIHFKSLFCLPPDAGTCRAYNDVVTKIVLERANKLIIYNFW